MEKIKIGKIVGAIALKGEVKVYTYSDPQRYSEIKQLYVEEGLHRIEAVRYKGNTVILKLSGIDDRNAAEANKEKNIYIDVNQLPDLPEDTYYIRDIVGFDIVTEQEEKLGILSDVLKNTAQDIYQVKRENGRELLIPGVAEFILDINLKEKKIKVRLPEGLLEL